MASGDAEIVAGDIPEKPADLVVDAGLASYFKAANVSISLKYYQQKAECWSAWQTRDLKGFSKIIEQLRQQTVNELRGRGEGGSPPCKDHKGRTKVAGFVQPRDVSDDIPFYEIHVHGKARARILRRIRLLSRLARSEPSRIPKPLASSDRPCRRAPTTGELQAGSSGLTVASVGR